MKKMAKLWHFDSKHENRLYIARNQQDLIFARGEYDLLCWFALNRELYVLKENGQKLNSFQRVPKKHYKLTKSFRILRE